MVGSSSGARGVGEGAGGRRALREVRAVGYWYWWAEEEEAPLKIEGGGGAKSILNGSSEGGGGGGEGGGGDEGGGDGDGFIGIGGGGAGLGGKGGHVKRGGGGLSPTPGSQVFSHDGRTCEPHGRICGLVGIGSSSPYHIGTLMFAHESIR